MEAGHPVVDGGSEASADGSMGDGAGAQQDPSVDGRRWRISRFRSRRRLRSDANASRVADPGKAAHCAEANAATALIGTRSRDSGTGYANLQAGSRTPSSSKNRWP
jgi:hypothetical protein